MEGATLGVHQTPLAKVVHVFELVAVEASGDVDPFAPSSSESERPSIDKHFKKFNYGPGVRQTVRQETS